MTRSGKSSRFSALAVLSKVISRRFSQSVSHQAVVSVAMSTVFVESLKDVLAVMVTSGVALVSGEFIEGYVQVYENLPEFVILTVEAMKTDAGAQVLHELRVEHLLIQLQATAQHDDTSVQIVSEDEPEVAGLDEVVEKRYILGIGDLPPSPYHVFYARAGEALRPERRRRYRR